MPQLLGSGFSQSVVYICEHNDDGAMGIVINKPMKIGLNDILEQLEFESSLTPQPIYWGGPVQEDKGFIIHTASKDSLESWESSLDIADSICLTTSKDIIKAIAEGSGPTHFLIALGYAGWGPGQLEQELAENAWLCSPADIDILFGTDASKKRQLAIAALGITEHQLNAQIGHA